MPCFIKAETLIQEIKQRLNPAALPVARDSIFSTSQQQEQKNDFYELADRIIKASTNSFMTRQYDTYQYMTVGYY